MMKRIPRFLIVAPVLAVVLAGPVSAGLCDKTAIAVREACEREARGDYWLALAGCYNLVADRRDRIACKEEAVEERADAVEECGEVFDAYGEVCTAVGQAPYDPVIDPNDFVQGVDNPFFPLVPGRTLVLEGVTDEGLEHVEVTVTGDTREIMGVECMIVRDVVSIDGEEAEDTEDYYAQDILGNVWYFGERSFVIEDGEIVDMEGSWLAGRDGAKPGIIMLAAPMVGETYRQEFQAGEAEDMGEVIDLNGSVTVPYGTFTGTHVIRDFTPIEPDANEHKHYASGVGIVAEIDLETGARIELIDILP